MHRHLALARPRPFTGALATGALATGAIATCAMAVSAMAAGPLAPHGGRQGRQPVRGVHGRGEPVPDDQLHRRRRRLGKHQDGHVDAGLAQLLALLRQGHAELGGPAGQGGPRHLDRAGARSHQP